MAEGGRAINTIQYERVGAIFKVSCQPKGGAGGREVDLRLNAELSALGQGGPEVSPGVRAPVTRSAEMNYNGPAEIGRALLLMSVDSSAGEKDATCVAYVCRVVLSEVP